jgi:ArsR family transcriptional regulator, lead/cadmium/zinc/bismuth-responsive transcriptional repressor
MFNCSYIGEVMGMSEEDDIRCLGQIVHPDILDTVQQGMPDEETMLTMADLFKLFGDGTRVKILCALSQSEMCVCDLTVLLGLTQSAVSHQLRLLKQSRLVNTRREGKMIYYALNDDHIDQIFAQALEHARE